MFDNTEIAFSHFDDKELKKARWLFKVINNNFLVKAGPPLTLFALKLGLPVLPLIRSTIFAHFCGGETIEDCEDNIAHLSEYGVGTILDYSVEGEKGKTAFDATADEIIDTIGRARQDEKVPFSVFKVTGIGRFELLEQWERPDTRNSLSADEKAEFERVRTRVNRICEESFNSGNRVLIDAEESWIQGTVDSLALEMMEKYNRGKAIVYNTYQLYRTDSLAALKAHTEEAARSGFFLGAKLVRGAYMEKERDRAEELRISSPIHADKPATDRDFNDAVSWCLDHIDRVAFMAGTHNEESCRLLAEGMAARNLPPSDERIYFAQLLGMSDNISFNLAHQGYRVAKYMPYGPVRSVLPYLFRRAQENTAIAGQMSRELRLIEQELKRRKRNKG